MKLCLALVLVSTLFSSAAAQESTTAKTTLTITANATGERVRITAPSSIVQMHVEVYAASGEKLFDQEIRGGNVFDWHLQDGQAQRLAPGTYVCVVTAKSVSGKITQKLGTVTVAEKSASVQSGSQQLSLQQTQAIGPVEADSSWTIAGESEPQTPTVIANDGTDGQMIRGRGALTFRIGNFFSGIDTEQMRLTETGDLGIGTSQPQSKLEVAGTIRAERFLVVKPKLGNGDKTAAASQATDATDGVQPLVAGTGTENQIAKWTDNAGTLGDSVITETPAGKVGVGIVSPLSKFHVSSSFDGLRLTSTNDTTPVWAQFNTSLGSGLGYFGVEGNTPGIFLAGTLPYATALSSGGSGTALQLGSAGSVKMTILSGGNVGVGTTSPGFRLDVADRIRVRQGGSASAGMWLFQTVPGSDRAFMGMQDDNHVGLWGNTGAGWGLTMDTTFGNVGIGNPSPGFKLHVIDQSNAGLRVQTNSTGGSVASFGGAGEFQVDAAGLPGGRFLIKESGSVGIGTQLPTEKLTVNGKIESIIGGFKFPDGTVQTTSANMTFTKLRGPDLTPLTMLGGNGNAGQQSAILMSVPTGTYVITATVEFRNNLNNFGQNNTRRITCNLTNADPFSFDIAGLSRQTVTFHSVQSVQGGQGNVGPFCFHNGAVVEDLQTATSKLTAIKIEGTVSVQTDP
jgi:hypothetical protein